MDNTTLVALIAAIGSLIVATISLISVIISSRNAARSSKEVETLKHSFSMERQAVEKKNTTYNEFLNSLCETIKAIQKVKDTVQRIVDAYKTSYYSDIAIKDVTIASEELFVCYEEQFTELLIQDCKVEKDLFHKAKALTLDIEGQLKSGLEQTKYASELTKDEKNRLRDLRFRLSDIQAQLQNSLSENLIKRETNREDSFRV